MPIQKTKIFVKYKNINKRKLELNLPKYNKK